MRIYTNTSRAVTKGINLSVAKQTGERKRNSCRAEFGGTRSTEILERRIECSRTSFPYWRKFVRCRFGAWSALGFLVLLATTSTAIAFGDWKQAQASFKLSFPRDHVSHPDYRIEWWYYTGNVLSPSGERFGYQLTFFRIGVDPKPANPSRWAVRDLFMTHFAITDIFGKRYRFSERINRSGVGWAGASTEQYHVWNQDWEVRLDERGHHHLIARNEEMSIDLMLSPGKPPVLHGMNGFSQKGGQRGNASHYYSLTRMPTSGRLTFAGRSFAVEGLSWMDHEFGTSVLEEDQVGWDWFSIQLEDGTELMLFQLRRLDGRADSHSSGTWVDASGYAKPIQFSEFEMKGTHPWQSVQSAARYPTEWEIQSASLKLNVLVKPAVLNQELQTKESTGVNYWEGAVEVVGTREGRPVKGRGYLEMTGYGGQVMSRLFK